VAGLTRADPPGCRRRPCLSRRRNAAPPSPSRCMRGRSCPWRTSPPSLGTSAHARHPGAAQAPRTRKRPSASGRPNPPRCSSTLCLHTPTSVNTDEAGIWGGTWIAHIGAMHTCRCMLHLLAKLVPAAHGSLIPLPVRATAGWWHVVPVRAVACRRQTHSEDDAYTSQPIAHRMVVNHSQR
jgi:hypothetical protein